jgi:hypothetical protein
MKKKKGLGFGFALMMDLIYLGLNMLELMALISGLFGGGLALMKIFDLIDDLFGNLKSFGLVKMSLFLMGLLCGPYFGF